MISVWLTGRAIFSSAGENVSSGQNQNIVKSVGDEDEDGSEVLASQELNVSYTFSALDSSSTPAGEVVFRIARAEKAQEVLVQGRPANAKGDKAFLVLHIEIDNSDIEKRYISPVDVLRLIGDEGKLFAPDIHSSVVEIQPISTKITRVGFVVLKARDNFQIQVGELEGEKQILEVNF